MTDGKAPPMTKLSELVRKLNTLLAKATPRPWNASPYRSCIGSQLWAGEPGPSAILICGDGDAESADAELIAETVNSLPDLLDAIERLERENAETIEWAFERARSHHYLAVDNPHLSTEHIASSSAYRELALKLQARASLSPSVEKGEE